MRIRPGVQDLPDACAEPLRSDARIRVIAFEVDHGDVIKPAYGYRIEYGGRSAVISGDTRYNEDVVKYGAGADLLIHEVAIARPELMSEAAFPTHHGASHRGARSRHGVPTG